MHRCRWLAAALGLLVLACSGTTAPDSAPGAAGPSAVATLPSGLEPSEPFDVTTVTLRDPEGTAVAIEVFDAHTSAMRQRGLMKREELPDSAGMVFRYPADSDGGYWMKNTLIPLSIAYFSSDGVVHTVLDMEPCEADPCPAYPPDAPYRGVLEVNQGFFEEIGLGPGWRVELPAGLAPPEA